MTKIRGGGKTHRLFFKPLVNNLSLLLTSTALFSRLARTTDTRCTALTGRLA